MTEYKKGRKTRELLIDTVGELAADVGFANVSMRAVAERSGENLGSIHYHFGSKDALFEEVVKTAIVDFKEQPPWRVVEDLTADASSAELSMAIREIVHRQIHLLFNPEKPSWHALVIYQLLQYEDSLFDLFEREVLKPDMVAMRKLFLMIDPSLGDDELLLHTLILNMPIFSHANYRSVILKLLKTSEYSAEYLQRLENLLVRQTQLLLGLPVG